MELADVLDSKSSGGDTVSVRPRSPAPDPPFIRAGGHIIFTAEVFAMPKEKRFIKTYSQSASAIEVWVDKQTGVNYLYHSAGYSGGLTVLLDKEGKPVITPITSE